jgi:glycogen debranching enzyme/glycosyltransferase involved in cell wall biosynthesis
MRIAQVPPLYEPVPPRLYGGTERIVSFLTEGLVRRNHEVTLFASADSKTSAMLIPVRDCALRSDPSGLVSPTAAHLAMLEEVCRRADEFDVIHVHLSHFIHFPVLKDLAAKVVTTPHGRLDYADLPNAYAQWPRFPLVSISKSQRRPLPDAHWIGNVYHGLPLDLFPPPTAKAERPYLAFLGRMSRAKRADRAIEIAKRAGMKLKLAAKIDTDDKPFFHEHVEPLIDGEQIEYLGEIGEQERTEFLQGAAALLFPIDWPEPFGMAVIEAMACGVPVIAWNEGAMPEIIDEGKTGFIVESIDQAVAAVERSRECDPEEIRAIFEKRFSVERMVEQYEEIYQRMTGQGHHAPVSSHLGNARSPGEMVSPHEAKIDPALTLAASGDSAVRYPHQQYTLKHEDCFIISDGQGDITGTGDGLFLSDTRILSHYSLTIGDQQTSMLSASLSHDNVFFTSNLVNSGSPRDSGVPNGVIHVERRRFLWRNRLYERVTLTNYSHLPLTVPVRFEFAADFHDMFEVRGAPRPQRGTEDAPEVNSVGVTRQYKGLDHVERHSAISFNPKPAELGQDTADFIVELPPHHSSAIHVEVGETIEEPGIERYRLAATRARLAMRGKRRTGAVLWSSGRIFNDWLVHARSDLALLTTELPTGPYPYAGIPWYSTAFGRDGIISALQTLWLEPVLAKGVLNFLAEHQATEFQPYSDAEPGKIMHETRRGEMTALRELPFARYYGGVDTTPLFICLAVAYAKRTGDMELIDRLWPHLCAAADWMESFNARNPHGFITYQRMESSGLLNQGWKDSADAVCHKDGTIPPGPIALVEVQGYAFYAYKGLADLAGRRGDRAQAAQWQKLSDKLRDAVESEFWMEDAGFYAMAIDGEGKQCTIRTSNAGHLLFVGLPSPERAARVAERLMSAQLFSGWGVRTLATDEIAYNPMAYHNGSVWPHDTGICAIGLARYNHKDATLQLASGMFEAAIQFHMRLPELFCGFIRAPGETPVPYPVACIPQAWSAGAGFMLVQACLGLRVDGWNNRIIVDRPTLPIGIDGLTVRGLQVGESRVDVIFQRLGRHVVCYLSERHVGDVALHVLQ